VKQKNSCLVKIFSTHWIWESEKKPLHCSNELLSKCAANYHGKWDMIKERWKTAQVGDVRGLGDL